MMRAFSRFLLIALVAAPVLFAACPCVIRFGVCDEARQSDAVFIGTVESVAPPFLDPYAQGKAMASLPADEIARLQSDPSPEALARLKKLYLEMFAGIPDSVAALITEATSQQDLESAFESLRSQGRFARFRVQTMFKAADEDQGGAKAPVPKILDVWTGSGDCGVDFQTGETYLVYAVQDEDSDRLQTSSCMRTRRLTEEQGDLGFLYFLQHTPQESTRLEGFVSTDQAAQSLPRYQDTVSGPAPGVIVELDNGTSRRYTQSDSAGRFSFDGLSGGNYRVSLLAPGFPRSPRKVLLTRSFHAAAEACARQILVLPAPLSP